MKHTHIMNYYSLVTNNEIFTAAVKQMDLEISC